MHKFYNSQEESAYTKNVQFDKKQLYYTKQHSELQEIGNILISPPHKSSATDYSVAVIV